MKVPPVITLQLVSAAETDLSGLIVGLTVSTGQRNPRRVYFPKTDHAGRSTLERHDFLGQFADYTEADLMGSWGTVDDAFSIVEVELYDPAPAIAAADGCLAWPLLPYERQKWPSRAAQYAYRVSCRNLQFTAEPTSVDLQATSHIQLQVAPAAPSPA